MIQPSSRDLSGIIGRIYDCTLDPAQWGPTLDALMRLLQCRTVQFWLFDLVRDRFLNYKSVGIKCDWLESQSGSGPQISEAAKRVLDGDPSMGPPPTPSRHFPSAAGNNSTYHRRCVPRQEAIYLARFDLMRSPTRLSALGLGRDESVGVFGARETELMRLLIPHLRRAVAISDMLDARTVKEACLSETLDALKLGVLLVNEKTHIIHANRAAETMMRCDGPLREVRGVLRAERPAASAALRAAVTAATRSNEAGIAATGLSVRLIDDGNPVVAHVLPLRGGDRRTPLNPKAVAAVFINTPLDEAKCAKTLASAFKLTQAETRVLIPMLSGKNLVEAAADVGVAMTTARTHLNKIFAKTGVSRQSDLIRLAAATAPVIA